jgi:hypothetical protein
MVIADFFNRKLSVVETGENANKLLLVNAVCIYPNDM